MTDAKSNGVLITRKRSGQVKPSNAMPALRRTAVCAPSAPISQRPQRVRTSAPSSGQDSNTVTGTPRRTRSAAAVSPTGPAPAMHTRSSIKQACVWRGPA
jgi:hypothetical protein